MSSPFGWLHSIMLITYSDGNIIFLFAPSLFIPTFSGTQIGRKTRTGCIPRQHCKVALRDCMEHGECVRTVVLCAHLCSFSFANSVLLTTNLLDLFMPFVILLLLEDYWILGCDTVFVSILSVPTFQRDLLCFTWRYSLPWRWRPVSMKRRYSYSFTSRHTVIL